MAKTAATAKSRAFTTDVPEITGRMPVAAAAVIYEGALLMFSSGAVTPVSGAGVFAGVAMETVTGGAAAGDITCKVRQQGSFEEYVNTDTPTLAIVGVAATLPEATDDDTIRVETGSAITGTPIGKFLKVLEPGVAAGKVLIGFKGAQAP